MSYQIPYSPTNVSIEKTRVQPPRLIIRGKRIIKKNPKIVKIKKNKTNHR